ncbi:MAG: alkaline phosphatase family protein [Gemmatimonadota bacterium]
MSRFTKVVVIGLDGLEPKIVDSMLQAGELPNLARLRDRGGYSRVATTTPAQTPVAWSTFATGVNPGGHGIYDFIRRDPKTYLPDLGLNRYEQKNAFLPPKAVNLRRGTPLWELLGAAGVPSAIIRCPCSYPPDAVKGGRMLSGMGVPDLRGGLGTSTFYTFDPAVQPQESESVVRLERRGDRVHAHLIGPRIPKTGADAKSDFTVEIRPAEGRALLRAEGSSDPLELRVGEWSKWLKVKFKLGLLQSVQGGVRFFVPRFEPDLELYASPINFAADAPMFPISNPWDYAGELTQRIGPFYTTGMVEDHGGLNNGRFDEAAYLSQCEQVMREREQMMRLELDRLEAGLCYVLFDTPDRVQHMFWRFGEPDHPANREHGTGSYGQVVRDHYRRCDLVVGEALARADDRTLVIVLSDHGFSSFQRGFHINSWLQQNGLLTLKPGTDPGEDAGEFFHNVDWSRTQAYALGIGSMYLNVKGREAQGTVDPADAPQLADRIVRGLTGVVDPERGKVAINGVATKADTYSGAFAAESPDLVVLFNAGYRASWTTALGGIPAGLFEDNVKKWSGDHIIDPTLVPGVLFMSTPFQGGAARLLDLAPTILSALGVPKGPAMEGESLLP